MRVSVSIVELKIGCIHLGAFVWLYRQSAFSEFPGGSCLMMNIELLLSQGWGCYIALSNPVHSSIRNKGVLCRCNSQKSPKYGFLEKKDLERDLSVHIFKWVSS